MDALTGDAAILYLGVMLDASNAGRMIDARRVARDAHLAQSAHRGAIIRLRTARILHRVHAGVNRCAPPPTSAPTACVSMPRAAKARRTSRNAPRGAPDRPPGCSHA